MQDIQNNLELAGCEPETFSSLNLIEKTFLSLKLNECSNQTTIEDHFFKKCQSREADDMSALCNSLEKGNLNESTSKINRTFDKCTAYDENNFAEWSCSECEENLCDLCQKAHLRVKLTKNYSLISLNKET